MIPVRVSRKEFALGYVIRNRWVQPKPPRWQPPFGRDARRSGRQVCIAKSAKPGAKGSVGRVSRRSCPPNNPPTSLCLWAGMPIRDSARKRGTEQLTSPAPPTSFLTCGIAALRRSGDEDVLPGEHAHAQELRRLAAERAEGDESLKIADALGELADVDGPVPLRHKTSSIALDATGHASKAGLLGLSTHVAEIHI